MAQLKVNSTAGGIRIVTLTDYGPNTGGGGGTKIIAGSVNGYNMNQHLTTTSTVTFSKVWGAVGNDYADAIDLDSPLEKIEFGKVYVYQNKKLGLSKKYAEKGIIGLATDTQGFMINGRKEDDLPTVSHLPVSVAGFVLAFVDKEYESGTSLTCTKNGFLTKANIFTKIFFPERILATFIKPMKEEIWNEVLVNGRYLVKVK